MNSNRHREPPRPEDRCRGDLERWPGSSAEQSCWRSEAFAEDLPAAPPVLAALPPAGALAGHRLPPQRPHFAALALERLR